MTEMLTVMDQTGLTMTSICNSGFTVKGYCSFQAISKFSLFAAC